MTVAWPRRLCYRGWGKGCGQVSRAQRGCGLGLGRGLVPGAWRRWAVCRTPGRVPVTSLEALVINQHWGHFCSDETTAESILAGPMGWEGPLGGSVGIRQGNPASRHLPRSSRVSGTPWGQHPEPPSTQPRPRHPLGRPRDKNILFRTRMVTWPERGGGTSLYCVLMCDCQPAPPVCPERPRQPR